MVRTIEKNGKSFFLWVNNDGLYGCIYEGWPSELRGLGLTTSTILGITLQPTELSALRAIEKNGKSFFLWVNNDGVYGCIYEGWPSELRGLGLTTSTILGIALQPTELSALRAIEKNGKSFPWVNNDGLYGCIYEGWSSEPSGLGLNYFLSFFFGSIMMACMAALMRGGPLS